MHTRDTLCQLASETSDKGHSEGGHYWSSERQSKLSPTSRNCHNTESHSNPLPPMHLTILLCTNQSHTCQTTSPPPPPPPLGDRCRMLNLTITYCKLSGTILEASCSCIKPHGSPLASNFISLLPSPSMGWLSHVVYTTMHDCK